MGAARSRENPDQAENSRRIDKEIESQKREQRRRNLVKILILGAGDAGKSTIMKQLRILHIQEFTHEEKQVHKCIIYSNMLESMRVLLEYMEDRKLSLPEDTEIHANKFKEFVKSRQSRQLCKLDDDLSTALQKLWSNDAVRNSASLPGHSQLDDSTPYFFGHLTRILDDAYEPTEEDIIRSRVRTTGIVEIRFKLTLNRREVKFQMVDVGGQRSERRKWIHCFEGVTAVLFVSPLAEFDQSLFEDSKTNRMKESLDLFGQIVNNKFFDKSSFILFLNKLDIFQEKVKKIRFAEFFPEYAGSNTENDIKQFIKQMFLSKVQTQAEGEKRKVYVHYTNATSTENINTVFTDVCDIIINALLKENIY